jgi:hypothetical protein
MKLETYLTDNNFEKKDLTILFTVGCVLNTVNGDTFPMMEDDTFDFNDPMNIVTEEMKVLVGMKMLLLKILSNILKK